MPKACSVRRPISETLKGFFCNKIMPIFYDGTMDTDEANKWRHSLLKNVQGKILEIGFGSGLTLAHYPESIKKLTTVDINTGLNKKAEARMKENKIAVDNHILQGSYLPFESQIFDTVVSSFTLCSIENIEISLSEIKRVLKTEGRFHFLDHGLSDEKNIMKWQNRLNPVQKVIGCGCHLNRNIAELIKAAGFEIAELENYYSKEHSKPYGYMYFGIAKKVS